MQMELLSMRPNSSSNCIPYMLTRMDNMLPVCSSYYLTKKKTYEDMFRHLINIYRERHLDLQFDAIHVDLESSVHVAIKAVFQDTQIKACCFHLTQAWYRQIQKVGLTAGMYRLSE